MNSVNLVGNLVKDWTSETTRNGKFVVKNSIAIRNSKENTVFIPLQAWQGTAGLLLDNTKKGDKIAISGYIDISQYEKDGKRNYYTYVVVNSITFCSSKKSEKE